MLRFLFYSLLLFVALGLGAAGAVYWWVAPQLPSDDEIRDVRFQTPLKIFSRDGKLIAEFGEKRRLPVGYSQIPPQMTQAFLAAEDDRFFSHPGVDWTAIARAAWELVQTGEKTQGGSTITMQVARNFFLSSEKTYTRKIKEIVLALRIEQAFDKERILELYLNRIFLGHRAYGVGAAAQVYYGKKLEELSLAEIAMIAALPKAPSTLNPVSNPTRAMERRTYVLNRMRALGFVSDAQYRDALDAPNTARLHGQQTDLEAAYIAEMARAYMQEKFGDLAQSEGFSVYTTVDSRLQHAATQAARGAIIAYDERHGYRGPEDHVALADDAGPDQFATLLDNVIELGELVPALVTGVQPKAVDVYIRNVGAATIPWQGLSWARKYLGTDRYGVAPESAEQIAAVGDIIRVRAVAGNAPAKVAADDESAANDESMTPVAEKDTAAAEQWRLAQLPQVEAALVSLDPNDGAIVALVGGFDFNKSKFNRAVQAKRQPGSNFKPFIYSAALENGYTPASFINDAPIVFDAPGLEATWRPENYSGRYYGPTRLREALANSRNLVSIRLLKSLGVQPTIDYVTRFGFDSARLPPNLSLSLGSAELTPLELVSGYAVFANGGYRVEPYFVDRIVRDNGEVAFENQPLAVCRECPQPLPQVEAGAVEQDADALTAADGDSAEIELAAEVDQGEQGNANPDHVAPLVIDPVNAWIMTSMMQDVIKHGTGRRALVLKRGDIAGKTGTTNDQKDAWFSGFNAALVTSVWLGFDQSVPLGRNETGSVAALPMWIDYMKVALADTPEAILQRPPGLVTVRIDPNTGLMATPNTPNAIYESFRAADVPASPSSQTAPGLTTSSGGQSSAQLF